MKDTLRSAIVAGEYEQATSLHAAYQRENGWPKTQLLNETLHRELGDSYHDWRNWIMHVKDNPIPEVEFTIASLLETTLLTKEELRQTLKSAGLNSTIIQTLGQYGIIGLEDPLQVGSRKRYASIRHVMHQRYPNLFRYDVEQGMIMWWRGIDARDLGPDELVVERAAMTLFTEGVSNSVKDKQVRDYSFHHWPGTEVSLTLSRAPEKVVEFWRTGS